MKCVRCGAYIPDDVMICPECGTEVQIVPDYNPLEDVLTREVRGSVEGATRQIKTGRVRRYNGAGVPQSDHSTRVISQSELDQIREQRRGSAGRTAQQGYSPRTPEERRGQTGSMRTGQIPRQTGSMRTGQMSRQTGSMRTGQIPRQGQTSRQSASDTARLRREADERRRQQQIRKKEAARRRRRKVLFLLFLFILLVAGGGYMVYQNSYPGVVRKGYDALHADAFSQAESLFKRAMSKDEAKPEAYTGLSEVYLAQGDEEKAEGVFLSAIESQPSNADLYQAAIDFYMEAGQSVKISPLLEECDDPKVLDVVGEYISEAPVFGLENGKYTEVQEVEITSETGGTIYYTTDGTDPSAGTGTKYKEPVLIKTEGKTEIRAIAVNEHGIPSVVSSAEYTIEFPIADAPAVSPTTGQHPAFTEITITVPDGYTAYYTTDGTDPTEESYQYTEPVAMPESGQIIFKAVLVNNSNGKYTDITTRNYVTR